MKKGIALSINMIVILAVVVILLMTVSSFFITSMNTSSEDITSNPDCDTYAEYYCSMSNYEYPKECLSYKVPNCPEKVGSDNTLVSKGKSIICHDICNNPAATQEDIESADCNC